jgi:hypothetical protein
MLDRRNFLLGGMALVGARSALAQGGTSSPHLGPPYTSQELELAERRFGIRFPPDLFQYLLKRRFVAGPDWAGGEQEVRALLGLPLEGIMFDIETNDFWAPFWGPRPATLDERHAVAQRLVASAPKLLPLAPDMFIPESPHRGGNPVFFVFLSDVRYYAANLDDYSDRLSTGRMRGPVRGPKRRIPFWTDLSEVQTRAAPGK